MEEEEKDKLSREGKCFVCQEPGHLAKEHKKGGSRYEKKTNGVKVNRARIEEIARPPRRTVIWEEARPSGIRH